MKCGPSIVTISILKLTFKSMSNVKHKKMTNGVTIYENGKYCYFFGKMYKEITQPFISIIYSDTRFQKFVEQDH